MHVPFDTLVARVLFSIVGHRTWLRGKIVALFVFGFLKCDPVSVVYLRDLSDTTPLFFYRPRISLISLSVDIAHRVSVSQLFIDSRIFAKLICYLRFHAFLKVSTGRRDNTARYLL